MPRDSREFMANGRKYIISEKISTLRYKEYEKLVPVLTFGVGFKEIFQHIRKAYDLLNKPVPEPGSACVVLHNTMNGIKMIDDPKRQHPGLLMAALVILREDEDPTKYDEQLMMDKISDWQEEGYDMLSFFVLSMNTIQGFKETLSAYTNQTLAALTTQLEYQD